MDRTYSKIWSTSLLLFGFVTSCAGEQKNLRMPELKDPPYVVINDEHQPKELRAILKKRADIVSFPMSNKDKKMLAILESKFDREVNCAGLAAPQIGFSKQMIVFAAPFDPKLKKWRPDFSQTMPKTIWLNPEYEPVDLEQHEDYEGCFSVHDHAGEVKRYKRIRYFANLIDGTRITGTAEGFLARIIQHEIDHVHGTLFIDKVSDGKLYSIDEYRKRRQQQMDGKD